MARDLLSDGNADEDVAYGQVVYAVETIRGLGAQAYFLSPRIRAEFNESASPTKR